MRAEDAMTATGVTREQIENMSLDEYSKFREVFMSSKGGSVNEIFARHGIGPNEVELTYDEKDNKAYNFGYECCACGEFFDGFKSRGYSLVDYKKHKLECEEQ